MSPCGTLSMKSRIRFRALSSFHAIVCSLPDDRESPNGSDLSTAGTLTEHLDFIQPYQLFSAHPVDYQ
jgi:hypothetical protein